jgi:hypothetical protein
MKIKLNTFKMNLFIACSIFHANIRTHVHMAFQREKHEDENEN